MLKVIEHAKITLWAVNRDKELILHEGSRIFTNNGDSTVPLLGRSIFEILGDQRDASGMPLHSLMGKPIADVLDGRASNETVEIAAETSQLYYRTRFVPLHRQQRAGPFEGETIVEGAVAVSMDVTELKKRELELLERDRENGRLHAQSEAAKEASKMKSQFLANMSHEIR